MQKYKGIIQSVIALSFMLLIAGIQGCQKEDAATNPPAGGGTPVGGSNTVSMQNSTFTPATLTVTVGTKVTWTNNDNMTHTVTSGTPGSPDGLFNSGNMAAGATFDHTFTTKGTFKYYCIIHQNTMQGTIVVQ